MEQQHMFTNRMIRNLLVPVVLEQILNSIMGTADTMMVSNVGSAALSAVSLVDSINVLLIQADVYKRQLSASLVKQRIHWQRCGLLRKRVSPRWRLSMWLAAVLPVKQIRCSTHLLVRRSLLLRPRHTAHSLWLCTVWL